MPLLRVATTQVALKALAVLEEQLSHAHSTASQAQQERKQLQHKLIASSLLGRHQVCSGAVRVRMHVRVHACVRRTPLPSPEDHTHTHTHVCRHTHTCTHTHTD